MDGVVVCLEPPVVLPSIDLQDGVDGRLVYRPGPLRISSS